MLSAEKTPYQNQTVSDQVAGTCMVCKQTKEKGIHILTKFICTTCEEEMVNTETNEEKYLLYVQRMRSLWLDPIWEDTKQNKENIDR